MPLHRHDLVASGPGGACAALVLRACVLDRNCSEGQTMGTTRGCHLLVTQPYASAQHRTVSLSQNRRMMLRCAVWHSSTADQTHMTVQ